MTVVGLALVGLIDWSRSLWLPFVAQWQYWHLMALRERMGDRTYGAVPAYQNHPLSGQLPLPMKLLEDGQWATESTKATLETLRRQYPQDASSLDYYLACWEFWSGDADGAREQLQRLGRPIDPVLFAVQVNDLAALAKLADDPSLAGESRARAWWELARRAESSGRRSEAAAAYLRMLENAVCGLPGRTPVDQAWEVVRLRLGGEISLADYRAALVRMAQRAQEQTWLEQIMFELGKLKILEEATIRKEAKHAKS